MPIRPFACSSTVLFNTSYGFLAWFEWLVFCVGPYSRNFLPVC